MNADCASASCAARLRSAGHEARLFRQSITALNVPFRYSAAFIATMVALILLYQFFFQREWAMRFFETGTGLSLFATACGVEVMGAFLLYWFLRNDF